MGEKKSRLYRFINKGNDRCAYCGGLGITSSIDHVPPTAFFKDKIRPNSMEIPACSECHPAFIHLDALCSFIFKLAFSKGNGDRDPKHLDNLINSAAHRFPEAIRIMATTRATNDFVLKNGVLHPVAVLHGLPTEAVVAIGLFTARTAAAIHYHIFKEIIPLGTVIHTMSWPDGVLGPNIKKRLIEGIPNLTTINQGSVDYSDQFEFRYSNRLENGEFRVFCHFKGAISAWAFVYDRHLPGDTDKLSFIVTDSGIKPCNENLKSEWEGRGVFDGPRRRI